jgi:hypothetical protein
MVAKSSLNYTAASAGKFIGIYGNGTQGVDDSGKCQTRLPATTQPQQPVRRDLT